MGNKSVVKLSGKVLLNGAFLDQAVTGQQRYARELASALGKEASISFRIARPEGWWARSPLRVWLWSQFLGFRLQKNEYLLTLTSRGPVVSPRHLVAVHDLFVLDHPDWYSKKYATSHGIVLRQQIRNARAILVVSEPVGKQVSLRTAGGKPIAVVPNAPSGVFLHERTKADIETTLNEHGLHHGKYILSVATVDPRKNTERLIAAHKALPVEQRREYPLVLVGAEHANFGSVTITHHEGMKKLGYVDDDALAHLYSGSAVVAFPSLDEGFGLPAVEALATGASLITSDVEVLRWVCGPHATYVDPTDVGSISQALSVAVESESVAAAVREERRNYVASRFNWTESSRQLTALVHKLSDRN